MAFRKYGGRNCAPLNNFVNSFISNSANQTFTQYSGQPNSKETFISNVDMSGNSIMKVGAIYFQDGTIMNTATSYLNTISSLTVGNDLSVSGTSTLTGDVATESELTVGSSLNVTGDSNLSGTVTAKNEIISSGSITAPSLIIGSSGSNGYIKVSSTGGIEIFGNVTINGTLNVIGDIIQETA